MDFDICMVFQNQMDTKSHRIFKLCGYFTFTEISVLHKVIQLQFCNLSKQQRCPPHTDGVSSVSGPPAYLKHQAIFLAGGLHFWVCYLHQGIPLCFHVCNIRGKRTRLLVAGRKSAGMTSPQTLFENDPLPQCTFSSGGNAFPM